MRARQLLTRRRPLDDLPPPNDRSAFQWLVAGGLIIPLGPGLVAGGPLWDRVLARLRARVLGACESLGPRRVVLPAGEGEALVNVLAHLGWLDGGGGVCAFAEGTGFRESSAPSESLESLSLYERFDLVHVPGRTPTPGAPDEGPPPAEAARDRLADLLVAGLQAAGLDHVERRPAAAPAEELVADGAVVGEVTVKSLVTEQGQPAAEVVLGRLDLTATLGVVAGRGVDERGLAWPAALAPFDATLIPAAGPEASAATAKLALDLEAAGLQVLHDDRELDAGTKRRDAEVWGLPWRILCGPTITEGQVVVEARAGGEPVRVALAEVAALLGARAGGGGLRRRALFAPGDMP